MTQTHETEVERRKNLGDISSKLGEMETDVAVIKADIERQAGIRKLMWGMSAMLLTQAIAGSVGYGKLQAKLDGMDLSGLRKDVSTALVVLGDHGTELQTVRDEQHRIRGVQDDMRKQFVSDLAARTDDRYRRSDWLANKLWLEEKFVNFEQRVEHLEESHHLREKQ